jgi:hypothetical protein
MWRTIASRKPDRRIVNFVPVSSAIGCKLRRASWTDGRASLSASDAENEEMHFVVDKDTETGEYAGARGTFQIACLSIEDPDRNSVDITKLVDQGKRFLSNDELKEYISGRFNIPVANIDLIAE